MRTFLVFVAVGGSILSFFFPFSNNSAQTTSTPMEVKDPMPVESCRDVVQQALLAHGYRRSHNPLAIEYVLSLLNEQSPTDERFGEALSSEEWARFERISADSLEVVERSPLCSDE